MHLTISQYYDNISQTSVSYQTTKSKDLLTWLKNPNLKLKMILIWNWEREKVSSVWFLFGQLFHSICASVIWAVNSGSWISWWKLSITTFWQSNLLWSLDKRKFFLPCLCYQQFLLSWKNKRVFRNFVWVFWQLMFPCHCIFAKHSAFYSQDL